MAKRRKIVRQEWRPNFLVRIIQFLWGTGLTLLKIALGGAATVAFIGIVCCFVLIGAAGDYLQSDVIPNVSFDLDSYNLDQTSFIYYVDSNGRIQDQQKIYTDVDRQWASYEEIPEDLIHAAVAIEDKRFYEHQGVDWITTVKACARMFFGNAGAGGSTITQQLIKNLTKEDSVTVQRKVQEIFRAQLFEAEYEKEVIMEWYLNTIYLGKGCYGVKTAALEYFGKNLEDLSVAECASLISITNNPSLYDPYIRPENNRSRQLTTLDQMRDQSWITEEEYQTAIAQEMVFTRELSYACPECDFLGLQEKFLTEDGATYYCPDCSAVVPIEDDDSGEVYTWFTEMVMDDVARDLAQKLGMGWDDATKKTCLAMIQKGGYHIYTTLDMEIQNIVDSVYTNLENVPTTLSAQQLLSAIVVIDNRTGDVVAVSGSVGEKTDFDAFSYASDGGLQTGSVMKPLTVYAPAFEAGIINPASVIKDEPLYDNFPKNESRTYSGFATVLTGVCKSLNTTAVHVLDKLGLQRSYDFATQKFRLNLLESETTSSGRTISDIGYSPLGLGGLTYGVTVREMAAAYATFPNGGTFREGRSYTKVYDSEGNLVLDNTQDSEKILSDRANNYINYCLRSVVTQGTGTYAALGSTAVAAKTGTTSDNRDRWFIGYTDYYTAAVWCGYEEPEQVRLSGSGINPALRMWKQVMEKVHQGKSWKEVHSTAGMSTVTMCMDSGKKASAVCPKTGSALVAQGDIAASQTCDLHVAVQWCDGGDGIPNEYCPQVPGNTISEKGVLKEDAEKKCTVHTAADLVVETQPPETTPATDAPSTDAPAG